MKKIIKEFIILTLLGWVMELADPKDGVDKGLIAAIYYYSSNKIKQSKDESERF